MYCTFTADYYSLGVLLLLMVTGDMLSVGKTLNEAKHNISMRKDNLTTSKFTQRYPEISEDWWDLMVSLLTTIQHQRIGVSNGVDEILEHSWFWDMDIESIKSQTFESPIYEIATCEETINLLIETSSEKLTQHWEQKERKALKSLNRTFIDDGEYYKDEFVEFMPVHVVESDTEGRNRESMMIMKNHTISSIRKKRDSISFDSPIITRSKDDDSPLENKMSNSIKFSYSSASRDLHSTNENWEDVQSGIVS